MSSSSLGRPRSRSALLSDVARFAEEDPRRTRRELALTCAVYASAITLAWHAPFASLRGLGALVAGLVLVRLFIFLHDIEHGAIFRGERVGRVFTGVLGPWVLTVPGTWREFHDAHHASTGRVLVGDLRTYRGGDRVNRSVDLETWSSLPRAERVGYRLARHGVVFACAWLTVFAIGICLGPAARAPRRHGLGPIFVLLHFGALWLFARAFGLATTMFVWVAPIALASALGAYLFFAQHNVPGLEFQPRDARWDPVHAALRGSSFFDMPAWMHWFTGNIGYHHVHHLNPRIPFYRLPDAMRAIPELADPIRTSFAPRDVVACLRLGVWDPLESELIRYDAADELVRARAASPRT